MVRRIEATEIAQALEAALQAVREANQNASSIEWEKGVTSLELADHLGISKDRVLKLIRKGIELGIVECSGRAARVNITGGMSVIPVYRVTERPTCEVAFGQGGID